jgi:hypothetical protein
MDAVEAKRLVKVGKELDTASRMLNGDYILGDIDDDIKTKVKQNESKLVADLQFYSMFYRLNKRKDKRKLKKRLKELIVAHYEEKGYKAKFRLFSLTLILDWRE